MDGLLLALCAVAEPNKGADIQIVGIVVFLGVFLFGILAVLFATFVAGCIIFALLPGRARLFTRIGILLVFLPVFIQTAKRGPRGYLEWLIHPSIRENEANQKAKKELTQKSKASGVLSVEREPDGVQITQQQRSIGTSAGCVYREIESRNPPLLSWRLRNIPSGSFRRKNEFSGEGDPYVSLQRSACGWEFAARVRVR